MDTNSLVEIRNSAIGEKGLFATRNFLAGQVVFILDGVIYNKPTRESIHVGNNVHIHDNHGAYINHSFDPSTRIEGRFVIALKDIKCDDEITFNYNDSEINMAAPFEVDGVKVQGKTEMIFNPVVSK